MVVGSLRIQLVQVVEVAAVQPANADDQVRQVLRAHAPQLGIAQAQQVREAAQKARRIVLARTGRGGRLVRGIVRAAFPFVVLEQSLLEIARGLVLRLSGVVGRRWPGFGRARTRLWGRFAILAFHADGHVEAADLALKVFPHFAHLLQLGDFFSCPEKRG